MPFVLEDAMTLAIRFYGVLLVLGSAIPLAMFVTVGQELLKYGNCQYLG
jgi:hypothetical protein